MSVPYIPQLSAAEKVPVKMQLWNVSVRALTETDKGNTYSFPMVQQEAPDIIDVAR